MIGTASAWMMAGSPAADASPTAVQSPSFQQVTWEKSDILVAARPGTATAVQVTPFHTSASACWSASGPSLPTAMQSNLETQETLDSVAGPALVGPAYGVVFQVRPFHTSRKDVTGDWAGG